MIIPRGVGRAIRDSRSALDDLGTDDGAQGLGEPIDVSDLPGRTVTPVAGRRQLSRVPHLSLRAPADPAGRHPTPVFPGHQ